MKKSEACPDCERVSQCGEIVKVDEACEDCEDICCGTIRKMGHICALHPRLCCDDRLVKVGEACEACEKICCSGDVLDKD